MTLRTDLMRQQYPVPRKSVKKLREMRRREGVTARELVRRAIEAYPSWNTLIEPEEEVASRMRCSSCGRRRCAVRTVEAAQTGFYAGMRKGA
jgi:hypothetical protein